MDELPDKVIQLEVLRINRNIGKRCTCLQPNYVLDPLNREVNCSKCGSRVDTFDAFYDLACHWERMEWEVEALLEQRKQIANYKPHLVVFKDLESQYRSKKMLPCCPECGKPFYFEHITSWHNRELEEKRRARNVKSQNDD